MQSPLHRSPPSHPSTGKHSSCSHQHPCFWLKCVSLSMWVVSIYSMSKEGSMMVIFDGQLHGLTIIMGTISEKFCEFLDKYNWGGKIHPQGESTIQWVRVHDRLKRRKWAQHWNSAPIASWLWRNVTSYCKLLPPCLSSCAVLYPPALSQNEPFLPLVVLSMLFVVIATKEAINIALFLTLYITPISIHLPPSYHVPQSILWPEVAGCTSLLCW